MKQIVIDAHNAIIGYCTGAGSVENGITVDTIPTDCVRGKYLYAPETKEITTNPKYDPGKIYDSETGEFVDLPEPEPPEPTFEEKQLEFDLDIDYRVTCLELGL